MKHLRLLVGTVIVWCFAAAVVHGQGVTTHQSMRIIHPSDPSKGILIQPPGTITSYSLTLPGAQGAASTVLLNDGNGLLSWTSAASLVTNTAWSLTGNTGTSASTNFIGTTDAVDFVARTNNTERMRISSAGNVGIGTTSPDSRVVSSYGTLAAFNSSDIRTTTSLLLTATDPGTTSANHGVSLAFRPINGRGAAATITVYNVSTNKEGGADIAFNSNVDGSGYPGTVSERMRITSVGNVGIGDATPAAMLTVGNGDLFQVNSSGAIAAVTGITTTGGYTQSGASVNTLSGATTVGGTLTLSSVATGTGSDDVLLINASNQVTKSTRASLIGGSAWALTGNTGTTNGGTLGSAPTGNYLGTSGTLASARDLSLVTQNLIRMQIDTGGVVSTQKDMSVNSVTVGRGAGNVVSNVAVGNAALAANTTGSNNTSVGAQSMQNNTSGNNNTSYGYQALLSNTTGNNNTVSGFQSMQSNTTGSGNTAGGFQSLQSNTTGNNNTGTGFQVLQSNTTGSNNTAVGTSALLSNTIGTSNTAVGLQSLQFNSTGTNNTALGSTSLRANTTGVGNTASGGSALEQNTIGSNNSAMGLNALFANTTGSNNSVTGVNALLSNTTGSSNSATGVNALRFNTTGEYNSATGVNALYSNTTGIYNAAMGANALYSNTTGFYNAATGANALFANTTGSNNSAMGLNALMSNTTGDNNSATGLNAGRYINAGADLTSVDNSVFLGADTRALAVGNTNTIVIGQGARGLGSNTAVLGNSSIAATRLQGRVGVGADPTTNAGDAQVQITPAAAANEGLLIKGASGQTADLLDLQNNAGTTQFRVGPSGATTVGGTLTLSSTASAAAADSVLMINSSNQVTKTTRAALVGSSWSLTGNASTNASTNFIGTTDAVDFVARTNNTERMRITSGGFVGIGTSSPVSVLQVMGGDITPAAGFGLNWPNDIGGGGMDDAYIKYYAESGENTKLQIGISNDGDDDIEFVQAGAARLNIYGGNVGVNNTMPAMALDVNGTFRASGTATLTSVAAGTTSDDVLLINASNQVTRSTRAALIANSGWSLTGNAGTSILSNFIGTTDAVDFVARTNNTERMRIMSTGRVGIGTSNPQGMLDVALGNTDAVYDMGEEAIVIRNTTTTAGARMGLRFTSGTNSAGLAQIDLLNGATTNEGILSFGTRNSAGTIGERMRITSAGDVGIGENSPTARLSVTSTGSGSVPALRITTTGADTWNYASSSMNANLPANGNVLHLLGQSESIYNSGFLGFRYVGAGSSSNMLYFGIYNTPALTLGLTLLASGNVGIGTTSPGQKLTLMDGNMYLDNSGTAGELRFREPSGSGSNFSSFKAGVQAGDISYTLPTALPANNGVMQTTNAGVLSWTDLGAGNSIVSTPGGVATRVAFWSGATTLTSNANLYWDNTNSRLGVGTAAPVTALDVVGNLAIGGGVAANGRTDYAYLTIARSGVADRRAAIQLKQGATSTWEFGADASNNNTNNFYFYDNAAAAYRMLIDPTGQVGFGLLAPTSRVHVDASTGTNSYLTFTNNATSGVTASDGMYMGLGSDLSANFFNREANPMIFGTSNTERMRITSTGDVGIGSTTPASALEIRRTVTNGTETSMLNTYAVGSNQNHGSSIDFRNDGAGYYAAIAGLDDASSDGRLEFRVSGNSAVNATKLTTSEAAMVIRRTGDVGIGVFNPATRLHVDKGTGTNTYLTLTNGSTSGQGSTDGLAVGILSDLTTRLWNYESSALVFGTSNTEQMRIAANGYVGINTNAPAAGIHYIRDSVIFSTDAFRPQNQSFFMLLANLNNASYQLRIQEPNGSGQNYTSLQSPIQAYDLRYTFPAIVPTVNQLLAVSTVSGSAAAGYDISLEWRTASGTGSPGPVSGTGVVGEVAWWSTTTQITSDPRLYWDDASLRLGVGTSSPDEKLDVEGHLLISNGNSLPNELRIAEPFYTTGNTSYTGFVAQPQTVNLTYTLPAAGPASSSFGSNRFALATDNNPGNNDTTSWQTFWSPQGNAGTTEGTSFIGTTDNQGLAFRTNNVERMRIHNGNLGIGTSSPNAQLQLSNTVANRKVVLFELANNDHQFYGLGIASNNLRFQIPASTDVFTFNAGTSTSASSELMRIQANGNVGIGTSSPISVLQVMGSDITPAAGFGLNWPDNIGGGGGDDAYIRYYVESGENTKLQIANGNDGDDDIEFVQAGAARLSITGGNVGVNTTAPATVLDVAGTFRASGTVTLTSVASGTTSDDILLINASNQVTRSTRAALIAASGWGLTGNASTNASSNFIGTTDAVDFVVRTTNAERLRVLSGGNVGIGDVSPASLFTVGNGDLFQVNSSGAIAAAAGITTTGNILINPTAGVAGQLQLRNPAGTFQTNIRAGAQGANITYTLPTAAPTAGQVLSSDASGTMSWTTVTGAGTTWSLTGNGSTNASSNFIGTTDAVDFVVRTSNAERLRVLSGGNVGIGTNNPGAQLTVNLPTQATNTVNSLLIARYQRPQTATVKWGNAFDVMLGSYGTSVSSQTRVDFRLADGGTDLPDATVMTLQGNGNVGIGDVSPASLFTVGNGDLFQVNSSGAIAAATGMTTTGNVLINPTTGVAGQLQLRNPAGTFQTNIQAGAQAANITYTLPTAAPTTNGQMLSATTGGVMSWTDPTSMVSTGVQFVRKSADEVVTSSTALQADDHLTVSIPANQTYEFDIVMYVTTNNATNGGMQFTVVSPAGSTVFLSSSKTSTANVGEGIITASGATDNISSLTTTLNKVILKGYVANAGTAGSVTVQWTQQSSSANETRVKVGSYLKATRVQ